MSEIIYMVGDATEPDRLWPGGQIVIAHIVNNLRAWGSGFVIPLGRKYPKAEHAYRYRFPGLLSKGGVVQVVPVGDGHYVANMVAQEGCAGPHPLNLDWLDVCLRRLGNWCLEEDCEVAMPKIGAGLGGGDWYVEIEPRIVEHLCQRGIRTTVYTLPPRKFLFDS